MPLETEEGDGEKRKEPQKRRRRRKKGHSSEAGPVFLANEESHYRDGEGEEEEHLSDLDNDIEEYILTEKEVRSTVHKAN